MHQIGRAIRNGVRLGCTIFRTAETAIAARENGRAHGAKLVAGFPLTDDPLRNDQRTFVLALVPCTDNALVVEDVCISRQWLVHGEALLAMYNHQKVDPCA